MKKILIAIVLVFTVFTAKALEIRGVCNLALTLESASFSLEASAVDGDLDMTAVMEMKLKSTSSFVQGDRTV